MAISDELAQIDISREEKDKLVEELMRYMLFKIHQNFDCPIKREEVNCTVTNVPALVIKEAADRLAATFGYEMMEVQGVRVRRTSGGPSQSSLFDAGEAKCYVLVSNLDPEVYSDYVEDKSAAHLSAFAFDVITTIHIAGGKMPEEDLWHQLKRVGLNEHDEAHPVLGNNKQLLEYLVKQRYLLKEKFAGPEGHFMMYELAERALDESISGKIKDLIPQIRARSTEQHLMEAIKAQLEEVTRLREEMATMMEAHLQSMEAEWQRIFQFVQILGERTGQPPPPWLFPSQPPATTPDPPSAYSNATVHSRLSEYTSMERAVHGPEYDLSTQDLDGEVVMRAGGGRKHGRCCIGDDTLDTATTPTLFQIGARNTSSSRAIRSWPDTAQHPIEALEAQFEEVRSLREETVARMEANRQSMEADWQMMEAHRQWMEQMFQWLRSVGEKMGQPPPPLLFPSQPPPATTPATIPNQSVASNDGPCHPAK